MIFLKNGETIKEETAVTVGMFDGVHLGHKALMDSLRAHAGGRKTLVFTFRAEDKESLFTNAEKHQLLEQTGLDYAYLQDCTPDFYGTPKECFIELLKKHYNMRLLVVGQDFCFGSGAEGNAEYLLQNADKFGITVQVVPPVLWEGEKISSTRIRRLVSQGNVSEAAKMLGGFYFAVGSVEEGNRIGSSMNFPTANINTLKIMPENGVYATLTEVDGKRFSSVTNVGVRPTVAPDGPVNMETNIFDFNSKIYGQTVTIYFVERLRDEVRFKGLDALRAQIASDKQQAQEILGALQK
jgi:riboflavin kinase / FMN adenylyltransferase